MFAINGQKTCFFAGHVEFVGKCRQASPSIAAHAAFAAVGVEVLNFEVEALLIVEEHKTICPDAKAAVAEEVDLCGGEACVEAGTVVKDEGDGGVKVAEFLAAQKFI